FVDYASYRRHYETTVERIRQRLEAGAARGEIRSDVGEIHAWAIAGMNVFLGMRYGLWDADADIGKVAQIANDLLANGLSPSDRPRDTRRAPLQCRGCAPDPENRSP